MVLLLRLAAAMLAAGLVATIVWAGMNANFRESFGRIIADPWGVVSLVDLYIGFIIAAVVIVIFERKKSVAALWVVPVFFLGNIVTAIWLAWRLPGLVRRLRTRSNCA